MTAPSAAPLAAWCTLIEGLSDATWIVDAASGGVVADNAEARRLLGAGGASLCGRRADSLIPAPEDLAYWAEAATGDAGPLASETVFVAADGRRLTLARSIRPLGDGRPGRPGHYLVVASDRSAQRRAEDEREQALAELQATLESTADGILVTDLRGGIRAFNRRFAQLWAIPEALLHERRDDAVQAWMQQCLSDGDGLKPDADAGPQAGDGAARLQLTSGRVLERIVRPLRCRGQTVGRVVSFRDLSEQIAAHHRIEQLSVTDALTGLPNRRRFSEQVARATQRARRDGRGFALLLIDLDRFRQVNDGLGHEVGDRVLVEMARRIGAGRRDDDLLGRTGGDQFALLLDGADAAAAEAAAQRVLDAVAQPYNHEGAPFTLTCSIGGALCPANGQTADELLRHAEAAVQAVKGGGRAAYRVQRGRGGADRRGDIRLEHAMRQALAAGRFRLHFQPQVDLRDGRVVGAEALVRWRDPALGEVPPSRFIPAAEASGFIVALGDWVLAQAVRQAAQWHAGGFEMPVAINVSALQFQQPHFVDRVADALAASGLPAALLELELTESILVHDADDALHRLRALARLGVRLAIDDFGTGYSSLAYLKRFPIGRLKIDRGFVRGLPGTDSDGAIVIAILQMARALGLRVIAEGVETEAQRQFLAAHGCDDYQGFLFAPALDDLSFEARCRVPADGAAGPQRRRMRLVSA